jgi:tRNA threonylcarbamoyladenosine biosynthesis protein TsaE
MRQPYTLNELSEIAAKVIDEAQHKTLLFYGEMGVGKTTLIKEIIKQLGSDDIVSSPTFSLVNEYHSRQGEKMYHFDFYRIEDETEALDIGIEDYFDDDTWCLIEWPEKVKNLLPLNAVEIHLSINEDDTRSIRTK